MKRTLFLVLLMIVLSYVGQALSSYIYDLKLLSFQRSLELVWDNLFFVSVVNLFLYIFETWRLRLIGHAFQLNISWRDSFGAIALNILFAWLSPAAILGAPALAYYLHKHNVPVAKAIAVAFIRSFSIIFVSALTTVGLHSFNLQGPIDNNGLQEKVFLVLSGFAVYILAIVILAHLPDRYLSKVRFAEVAGKQVRSFFSTGKKYLLPILFLGLIINFILVAFIPYILSSFYGSQLVLVSQSLLFLSYLLLMPTPGATGLAEVGAPMFFSGAVSTDHLIATVSAMRIATIGPQVIVGMVFMFWFFRRNLSISELRDFRKIRK